jgi:hypothetical protein
MSGLQLLAPAGLLALIGIPLVVLYHMRHTTPVPLEVPSLRFWRMATRQESEHERFRRPPINLLFILHLLLVGLIAFALARPAASRALGGFGARMEPRHVIMLIDGSTSMSAIDPATGETRFDTERKMAVDRLGDLQEGDVATVILMGTHSSTFEATDTAGLKALRERIGSLSLPGGRVDLNAALNLTSDLLLPSMSNQVVVLTDGVLSADPTVVAQVHAPIELVTVPGGRTDNVAITDIATRASSATPGQQQLYARIVNFGPDAVTAPVVITADGIEVSRADVTIDPNGKSQEVVQDLPTGATTVDVKIDHPDALPADNTASSILVQGDNFGLRVLLVTDIPTALNRALTVLPGAQVKVISLNEASTTTIDGAYDLTVFEHVLPPSQLPNTPVLFVNPPPGGLFQTNGMMANPTVQRVLAQDPLLKGVDLSGVNFGQTPVHVLDATSTEVVGAEAGPLIYRGTAAGTGQPMVVLAFDIAQSNLPQRIAFPILIANITGELAPSPLPSAVPLGDPLNYQPRAGAASVQFTPPNGQPVDMQVDTGEAGAQQSDRLRKLSYADTGQPGQYQVTELDASGNAIGGGRFVVNAGHPQESNLTPNPDLPSVLSQAHATGNAGIASGLSDFWPSLAAAAFLVLLFEWLLTLLPRRPRRRVRRPAVAPTG